MNRPTRKGWKRFVIWGAVVCFGSFLIFLYYFTNPSKKSNHELPDSSYFIAHGTGSLDGYTYLNSKESLLNALDNGYQYIEVDLGYTSDSTVVCVHEWKRFNKMTIDGISENDSDQYSRIPSLEEFKQRKIYGKYSPMTLDEVVQIWKERPFKLVLDKFDITEDLNKFFPKEKRGEIMVEAYTEEGFEELKAAGYIPMVSTEGLNLMDCISFICSHLFSGRGYWVVVEQRESSMRGLRLLKKLFGLKYAMYTVNSPWFYRECLGSDVELVYTDNWDLKRQINTFQDNDTY